jgi:VanZ family protein
MGAMNETSRFIRPLLEFLFPSATPETLTLIHGNIRKLAHLVEYALLAFLAIRAFESLKLKYLLSFIFVVAVAAVDETKQSFDPSRTSSPWDVVLDSIGGLAAILLFWLSVRRKRSA